MNPAAALAPRAPPRPLALFLLLCACPPGPGASASEGSGGSTSTTTTTTSASAPTTATSAPGDQPPTAAIAADPLAGPAPLVVGLHGGLSSDPEGPIAGYTWTFHDGTEAAGADVERVYAEPGEYEVTLTVTDSIGQTGAAKTTITATADCPTFAATASPGSLTPAAISEASGLAVSRRSPGVFWTHNDSDPDGPYVYAFATADARYLGRYSLQSANVVDWEDMAVGPGTTPDTDALYVGDIGDNNEARGSIVVYRVAEPPVDPRQAPVDAALSPVEDLAFTYPGGQAHDAETLLVDPVLGDLCVVTKRLEGPVEVYCTAAPLASGTLALAATLDVGASGLTTGGSVSPDGRLVAVRTYLDARVWRRPPSAPLADAFLGASCPLALTLELQGEALGFAIDSLGYYTVSEGMAPVLHAYRRQ